MLTSSTPGAGLAGLLAGLLLAATAGAEEPLPDGRSLVEHLVRRQQQRETLLDALSYDVVERREELARDGSVSKLSRRRYEVFHVGGRPLRRLVAENGTPLSPESQAKEDRRIRALSEAIRAGNVVTEKPGVRLSRLLEHYDVEAEGRLPGPQGSALVFRIRPRPDVRGPAPRWLRALEGRLWIDEDEQELLRVDLRNTQGIRFALGVGASVAALGFELEHAKVKEGLWLPRQLVTYARGRRFPWRRFHVRRTVRWENFRSFDVTTHEEIEVP